MGAGQQTDGARSKLEHCGSWEEVGRCRGGRRERALTWERVLLERRKQRTGPTGGEMVEEKEKWHEDGAVKLDGN